MQEVVGVLRGEFKEYQKPISDPARADLFKRIVANDQKLHELRNLLHGAGQPSHAFWVVALAQGPSSGSAAPYNTISENGGSLASNQKAGYEYAKYIALNKMAYRVAANQNHDSLTLYLAKFAEATKSDCRSEGPVNDQMFRCTVDIELNSVYLNPAVINRFAGIGKAPPPAAELRTSAKVLSTPVSIPLRSKGKQGEPSFEFIFVQRPFGADLELRELRCFEGGLWSFIIEGANSIGLEV